MKLAGQATKPRDIMSTSIWSKTKLIGIFKQLRNARIARKFKQKKRHATPKSGCHPSHWIRPMQLNTLVLDAAIIQTQRMRNHMGIKKNTLMPPKQPTPIIGPLQTPLISLGNNCSGFAVNHVATSSKQPTGGITRKLPNTNPGHIANNFPKQSRSRQNPFLTAQVKHYRPSFIQLENRLRLTEFIPHKSIGFVNSQKLFPRLEICLQSSKVGEAASHLTWRQGPSATTDSIDKILPGGKAFPINAKQHQRPTDNFIEVKKSVLSIVLKRDQGFHLPSRNTSTSMSNA